MRRRLPVIQPSAVEDLQLQRRAFLLGIVGTVAACASDDGATQPRRNVGSSGGTTSGTDGGKTTLPDGSVVDTDPDPVVDSGTGTGVNDAGVDAAPSPGCAVAGVDCGAPGSFAMGVVKYVASANVLIGRDAGGLYAMYALCTHTIGNLEIQANQIRCVVHGATFSLTGQSPTAPANQPLPHFSLCLKNGNVAVDTKIIVPPSTRLSA